MIFPNIAPRFVSLAALLLVGVRTVTAAELTTPVELRCEYQAQPLDISIPAPRFSWQWPVGADVTQESYQVEVTDPSGRIQWDSGKVKSDSAYTSRVKVWSESGVVSRWFASARFETGKLLRDDFRGFWISTSGKNGEAARRRWICSGGCGWGNPFGWKWIGRRALAGRGESLGRGRGAAQGPSGRRVFRTAHGEPRRESSLG